MECLDGMAQVACDCGRYDEAIDLWSQAVAVSEEPNEELFANLGECRLCSARTGLLRDAGVRKPWLYISGIFRAISRPWELLHSQCQKRRHYTAHP